MNNMMFMQMKDGGMGYNLIMSQAIIDAFNDAIARLAADSKFKTFGDKVIAKTEEDFWFKPNNGLLEAHKKVTLPVYKKLTQEELMQAIKKQSKNITWQ